MNSSPGSGATPPTGQPRTSGHAPLGEIVVDLDAIRHNVGVLRQAAAPAATMVVVKADAYGHGMVPVARAAREAGADWLGVATIDEALRLRAAGDEGRLLCWLTLPGDAYDEALAGDLDLGTSTLAGLAEIEAAARAQGCVARVHLKVDTGLTRGGAHPDEWDDLMAQARAAELRGDVRIVGLFSHLVASDEPDNPVNLAQENSFVEACETAAAAGLTPEVRHLSNTAGAVLHPSTRFDMVRFGIGVYGLDPTGGQMAHLRLRPAMTVRTRLALVKPMSAGEGVSYGHIWIAEEDTTVGLVPLGYGEGIPRHISSRGEVWVDGKRRQIRGRICMDQFVVDLGGDRPEVGSEVLIFGPGQVGEPTADDWAVASDTINYEIVTRLRGRLSRRYVPDET